LAEDIVVESDLTELSPADNPDQLIPG